jgi:O-antigen/teichoic acid export membrane protein
VPDAGERVARLVWAAYGVSLGVTAIMAAVVFGAMAVTGQRSMTLNGLSSPFGVLLLVAGTMSWTLFNLQDGVLIGLRRTIWVPFENGLYGLAKIVLLVGLAGTLPALGILSSWIVPMIATAIIVTLLIRRWLPAHMRSNAGRSTMLNRDRLIRLAAADYLGSLFALAVTALLPVLIVAISDARSGAYFYIVWMIAASMNLLPISMCSSMTVEALEAGADLSVEVRRTALHMARLVVPLVVALIVLSDEIMRIFGSDYVAGGSTSLRILAVAVIPLAVNTLYMAMLRIRARGAEILRVQAGLALITLGGSVIALPLAGIAGVAVAWLVGEGTIAIVATRRLLPLFRSGSSGSAGIAEPGA